MQILEMFGETNEYEKKEKLETKKIVNWCKTICAFSNYGGGKLIFGINNEDVVVGLDNAIKDCDMISNFIKTYIEPLPNYNLEIKEIDSKKIIIVTVVEGNAPPYYFTMNGSRRTFRRNGNETNEIDVKRLNELILKGSNTTYDQLISGYFKNNYTFNKLMKMFSESSGTELLETDFASFGLVGEEDFLTNAGALLADDSPIKSSRLFCTRWNGNDKANGNIDALDDKEFAGGVLQILEYAENFIELHNKVMWTKKDNKRIDLPDYGKRAVFEALVNAIIHRDYMKQGSQINIDMFDDRLIITSPGGMLGNSANSEVDPLLIASNRRNPVLADLFSRLRLMERRGSGLIKILKDYEEHESYNSDKKPRFLIKNESFIVELPNLNYVKEDPSTESTNLISLDKIDFAIISELETNNTITIRELSERLDISRSVLSRRINLLEQMRVVSKQGSNRNRFYTVVQQYVKREDE